MSVLRHGFPTAAVSLAAVLWLFPGTREAAVSAQLPGRVPGALVDAAQTRGTVSVIVSLAVAFRPEGELPTRAAVAAQRAAIANAQAAVLGALILPAPASVKRFPTVPAVAFEADATILDALERLPQVSRVEEDVAHAPHLAQSTHLVGATAARDSGFSGAGWAVAILDTGVDGTHSFLTGKVVAEACFSSNTSSSTSLCPDGASSSTAPGSGLNCEGISGCEHGTHVAGIAAGTGTSFGGVAPGANLIAIQVFSEFFTASVCGSTTPCLRSFTSDQIRALEHVATLVGTFDVAAANLSLGGGLFTSPCDTASQKPAIDNLRSLGVATVISAGNNGATNALSSPACVSTAVSVGSTGDGSLGATADVVSSFSNRAYFLRLLAPGQWINSSVPGNTFANFAGTSMSAPHVTGAWAVLKSATPVASVTDILAALANTGKPIFDAASGLTKPRIQIDQALPAEPPLPPAASSVPVPGGDFDGDRTSDVAVFVPSTGSWNILKSSTGFTGRSAYIWGLDGDVPAAGDYDGDGTSDPTLFRPSNGVWYILKSSSNFNVGVAYQWGASGDIPVGGGDYDGDGRSDLTIFRPSTSMWYILKSSTNFNVGVAYRWGATGDIPVGGGDYDGDGRTDLTIFRPSNNVWYILKSGTNFTVGAAYQWGLAGDVPMRGSDYDGDGRADLTIFRPSGSTWYVLKSSANFSAGMAFTWGLDGDVPAPGDYDGDGRTDPTVYRPSTGTWHVLQSSTNFSVGVAYK